MSKIPSYRLHKASGQAVVTLNGRDVYLGPHGSGESRDAYRRVMAEWFAAGQVARPRPGPLTVAELAEQYLAFAKGYYRKDGKPTTQLDRVERSLAHALDLYGETPAAEFSPLKLKAVRQSMIDADWSRRHVNTCVGCVKRCWKWGVGEELVPAGAYHGLQAVEGLRAGRSAAREGRRIVPAPVAAVRAVQDGVSSPLAALIDVQLWSGMRPGEAVLIRPDDVERSGRVQLSHDVIDLPAGVWVYRPAVHKTQHHGRERVVLLGPRAQAALAPFLLRDAAAYCFSPAEATAERRAAQRAARKSKVQPSQADRSKPSPRKRPGLRYTTGTYARAVADACDRLGVPHWHPNQLRHSAATALAAEFGPEVARIALGQQTLSVTRIYMEDDLTKAAKAVAAAG